MTWYLYFQILLGFFSGYVSWTIAYRLGFQKGVRHSADKVREFREKLNFENREPPHCPSCDCATLAAQNPPRMKAKSDTIEDYIRRLPWHSRLRVWFSRFKVRYLLWKGWRPSIQALCRKCLHPIELNDDNEVCIKCGGLNWRATKERSHGNRARHSDEIVGRDCSVHIERMDDNHVWIGITCGQDHLHVHYYSGAPITATVEQWHE